MLRKILNFTLEKLGVIFSIYLVFYYYLGNLLQDLWKHSIISGWDGSFHYNIYKKFSEDVFPNLYGWISNWNLGTPWPIGYPPLLSYFFSFINRISTLSDIENFKLVVITSIYISPILIYIILKEIYLQKKYALVGTILYILFLVSNYNFAGTLGVTIRSTIENGLYPQFLSTVLLFFWYYLWLKFKNKNTKLYYISSNILASIVLLTNVHVAQILFIVLGAYTIYDIIIVIQKNNKLGMSKYIKPMRDLFVYILSIFATCSFWIFPLLEQRNYLLTRPLSQMPLEVTISSIFIFIFLSILGIYFIIKSKDNYLNSNLMPIILASMVILFICLVPLQEAFPWLPLQPFRLFPYFYIFCLILSISGIKYISTKIEVKYNFEIISLIILLILNLWFVPLNHKSNINLFDLNDGDKTLSEYLKTKNDGRISLEVWNDGIIPTHVLLSSVIPENSNAQMLWGVFRESAVTGPYVAPVRNSFSMSHESFGIACWLCQEYKYQQYKEGPDQYYTQKIELQLSRAKIMNLKYIVVKSTNIASELIANANKYNIELDKVINHWYIFKINNANYARNLNTEPILVITNILSGDRPSDSYDWHRINEEWLYQANTNIIFVKSKSDTLDNNNDISKFKNVFVPNLKYNDIENTVKLMKDNVDKNYYILDNEDKLINRVKVFPNVKILPKLKNVRESIGNLYTQINENMDIKKEYTINDKVKYINQYIDLGSDKNQKLYISESYNPWWNLLENDKYTSDNVYMASPAFIYIHNTNSNKLVFNVNQSSVNLGTIISISTICLLLTIACMHINNNFIKKRYRNIHYT